MAALLAVRGADAPADGGIFESARDGRAAISR